MGSTPPPKKLYMGWGRHHHQRSSTWDGVDTTTKEALHGMGSTPPPKKLYMGWGRHHHQRSSTWDGVDTTTKEALHGTGSTPPPKKLYIGWGRHHHQRSSTWDGVDTTTKEALHYGLKHRILLRPVNERTLKSAMKILLHRIKENVTQLPILFI